MPLENNVPQSRPPIPFGFSKFIQKKPTDNVLADSAREEYVRYLVSVFGSAEAVLDLDYTIELYNKNFQDLQNHAKVASENFDKRAREIEAIATRFHACAKILDSFKAYCDVLHRCLKQDERMRGSVLEPLWTLWRGAEYSQMSRHVCNKFQKNIFQHSLIFSFWMVKFVEMHEDLDQESFYKIHASLVLLRCQVWQARLQSVIDVFGEVSLKPCFWLGASIRRELFFRVIVGGKKIQEKLDELEVRRYFDDFSKDFEKICTLYLKINSEISWCKAQFSRISWIWQRSTRKLLKEYIFYYEEKIRQLNTKKVRFYCNFVEKTPISMEKFEFLSAGLPKEMLEAMRYVQKNLQEKSYYSKKIELCLIEKLKALQDYSADKFSAEYFEKIVLRYRENSIFYCFEKIRDFLHSDKNWVLELEDQSKSQLDDMLNVVHCAPRVWIESYIEFYKDLVAEYLINSDKNLCAAERISQLLKEKTSLFSAEDKAKMSVLDDFVLCAKKLPKTGGSFFDHLVGILKMSVDVMQLFYLAEKYYKNSLKVMQYMREKLQSNPQFDRQKKVLAMLMYRHMCLLPEMARKQLSGLAIVQNMSQENAQLLNLIHFEKQFMQRKSDKAGQETMRFVYSSLG